MEVAWPRMLPPAPVVFYLRIRLQAIRFAPANASHLQPPFHPYGSPEGELGGYFLWPYAGNCFPPDVIRHRALWSADFPRFRDFSDRGHLTDLGHRDITMKPPAGLVECVSSVIKNKQLFHTLILRLVFRL